MTDSEPLVLYVCEGPPVIGGDLPGGYSFLVWKPTIRHPIPPTLGLKSGAWTLFDRCGLFANDAYCVVFIRHEGRIVHRSCVLPRYFRWPFMGEEDLQVSATWTEPKFRGKGLARVALAHIVRTMAAPGRRFWYVSRESNIASIRVCRHVGFEFSCYATRRTPFRLYSLGKVEEVPEPPRGEIEGWRPLGRETETAAWYARYYSRAGADRNDLRMNRGVMFQTIAFERSFISALYRLPLELPGISVLDVGCGAGTSWYQLFRLGINPHKTVGIDLQFDRLARIGRLYPQSTGIHADATCMPFANAVFDLVYESTLFATLSDDRVRADIAAEMVRVLRPNGYLLLVDWRTPQPWNRNYSALTRTEVRRLFGIDKTTSLVCVSQGALIPPVGRLLSTYAQSLYFLVAGLCPPLVGQVAYLLRKH